MNRTYTIIGGLMGLAVLALLIAHEGYSDLVGMLRQAGWGLLWLVPFHILPLALDAEGWLVLLRPRDPDGHATRPFLIWIAFVREAISRLLPSASIGGEIVGIRLVARRPVSGTAVAASVVVEVLLTMINQSLFTALGIALLIVIVEQPPFLDTLIAGLALSLPLPVAFAAVLRYGSPFTYLVGFAEKVIGDRFGIAALLGNAAGLDYEIRALFKDPARLSLALGWQLAGMIVGSFETWFALDLLGHPVSASAAIALESLWLAVRHAVFFLPGALGVQETALVMIGGLIGLPPNAAIALSLAKRFRELVTGLPALASWQWAETRALAYKVQAQPRR
jgi:putative membrane protein